MKTLKNATRDIETHFLSRKKSILNANIINIFKIKIVFKENTWQNLEPEKRKTILVSWTSTWPLIWARCLTGMWSSCFCSSLQNTRPSKTYVCKCFALASWAFVWFLFERQPIIFLLNQIKKLNQVIIWDKIVLKDENMKLELKSSKTKYPLWDDGNGLRYNLMKSHLVYFRKTTQVVIYILWFCFLFLCCCLTEETITSPCIWHGT